MPKVLLFILYKNAINGTYSVTCKANSTYLHFSLYLYSIENIVSFILFIIIKIFFITDDSQWQTIVRTSNGLLIEYSVSYQNLLDNYIHVIKFICMNPKILLKFFDYNYLIHKQY